MLQTPECSGRTARRPSGALSVWPLRWVSAVPVSLPHLLRGLPTSLPRSTPCTGLVSAPGGKPHWRTFLPISCLGRHQSPRLVLVGPTFQNSSLSKFWAAMTNHAWNNGPDSKYSVPGPPLTGSTATTVQTGCHTDLPDLLRERSHINALHDRWSCVGQCAV